MKELENLMPEIKTIVSDLGTSKIRTANFSLKTINQLRYSNSKEANNAVKEKILELFKVGEVYISAEVKKELQTIYDKLKLSKKAKTTDLKEYFEVSSSKKNKINSLKINRKL